MGDLVGREGRGRPKPHPARLGCDPAGAGALHDQGPLEVGHAGEHGQHHPPGWGGGIGPRLGQGTQARTGLLDALGDLQEVAGGAGQAIQARHRHHVAVAQMIEQPPQLGPVALRAAELFLKNPSAAGFAQRGPLLGEVLALGGHAGVADQRAGRGLFGHERAPFNQAQRRRRQPPPERQDETAKPRQSARSPGVFRG